MLYTPKNKISKIYQGRLMLNNKVTIIGQNTFSRLYNLKWVSPFSAFRQETRQVANISVQYEHCNIQIPDNIPSKIVLICYMKI